MSWWNRQGIMAGVALIVGLYHVHRMTSMMADPRSTGPSGRGGDGAHDEWLALAGGPSAAAAWSTARTILTRVAREPGWTVVESVTPPAVGGGRDHLQRRPARRLSIVQAAETGDAQPAVLEAATFPLAHLVPHEGPLPQHQLPLRHMVHAAAGAAHGGRGGPGGMPNGRGGSAGSGWFTTMRSAISGAMPGAHAGHSSRSRTGAPGAPGVPGAAPSPLQFDIMLLRRLSPQGDTGRDTVTAHIRWWRDGYGCMMAAARAAGRPPSQRGPLAPPPPPAHRHSGLPPAEASQRLLQEVHGRIIAAPLACECGNGGIGSERLCWAVVWAALPQPMQQALQALHAQGLIAQILVPVHESAAATAVGAAAAIETPLHQSTSQVVVPKIAEEGAGPAGAVDIVDTVAPVAAAVGVDGEVVVMGGAKSDPATASSGGGDGT